MHLEEAINLTYVKEKPSIVLSESYTTQNVGLFNSLVVFEFLEKENLKIKQNRYFHYTRK